MYIDYLCTAALADQVGGVLVGARIQDVIQVDRLSVALELYHGRRSYLLLSADPAEPGLRLGSRKARRGDTPPSPLALALSARAQGARLLRVTQPPFERILVFGIGRGEAVELQLVAELMGRLANLILLDERGRILAAARQVTGEMSRARTILPGQAYQPPPPPQKVDPSQVGAAELGSWLAEAGKGPAWRVLVARILGISPLAAREVVARASGDDGQAVTEVDPEALHEALAELTALPGNGRWEPGLAFETEDADAAPAAYAPYRLDHYARWEPCESIATAIERHHLARAGRDAYAQARAGVQTLLDEARQRAERQRAALDRQAVDPGQIDRLRLAGDLLLAYQTQIPAGASEAELEGPEGPLRVTLDPALSAVENAQGKYERARRASRAAEALPERRAEAEARLATIEQLSSDLALAEDRSAIDAVAEDLRQSGLLGRPLPQRQAGSRAGKPLSRLSSDGLTILVGRNRRQNEIVTFERGARGDLWLHARGIPGAHVVIKSAGREVPQRTLIEAAGLAAWFSRARSEARVEVILTELRHVSRMRGGGPGMVHYRQERTLVAPPLDPRSLAG